MAQPTHSSSRTMIPATAADLLSEAAAARRARRVTYRGQLQVHAAMALFACTLGACYGLNLHTASAVRMPLPSALIASSWPHIRHAAGCIQLQDGSSSCQQASTASALDSSIDTVTAAAAAPSAVSAEGLTVYRTGPSVALEPAVMPGKFVVHTDLVSGGQGDMPTCTAAGAAAKGSALAELPCTQPASGLHKGLHTDMHAGEHGKASEQPSNASTDSSLEHGMEAAAGPAKRDVSYSRPAACGPYQPRPKLHGCSSDTHVPYEHYSATTALARSSGDIVSAASAVKVFADVKDEEDEQDRQDAADRKQQVVNYIMLTSNDISISGSHLNAAAKASEAARLAESLLHYPRVKPLAWAPMPGAQSLSAAVRTAAAAAAAAAACAAGPAGAAGALNQCLQKGVVTQPSSRPHPHMQRRHWSTQQQQQQQQQPSGSSSTAPNVQQTEQRHSGLAGDVPGWQQRMAHALAEPAHLLAAAVQGLQHHQQQPASSAAGSDNGPTNPATATAQSTTSRTTGAVQLPNPHASHCAVFTDKGWVRVAHRYCDEGQAVARCKADNCSEEYLNNMIEESGYYQDMYEDNEDEETPAGDEEAGAKGQGSLADDASSAGRRLQQVGPPILIGGGTLLGGLTTAIIPVSITDLGFNCSTLSGLAACAEPQCADIFSLQRTANGSVVCRATGKRAAAAAKATIVIPYTYDQIFQFGSNAVLGGFSVGTQSAQTASYRTNLQAFPFVTASNDNIFRAATSIGSKFATEVVGQATVSQGTTAAISTTAPLQASFGVNLGTLTLLNVLAAYLPGRIGTERAFPSDTRPFVVFGGQFGFIGTGDR